MKQEENVWKFIECGEDGNVELFGVNIFDYEWEKTGERINVADPQCGKTHKGFHVYTVGIKGCKYTFAAGEFSNCVWGFYIK